MPEDRDPFEFDCEEDDILDFILGDSTCTDWIRGSRNLARRFRYRESGREKPRIVECGIDPGNTAELIDREINQIGKYSGFLGFLRVDPEGLRRVREGERAEDVLTDEEQRTVRRLVSFALLWKDARKREVLVWSPEIEAETLREIAEMEQSIASAEEKIKILQADVSDAEQRVVQLYREVPEPPPGYEKKLQDFLLSWTYVPRTNYAVGMVSEILKKKYKDRFGQPIPWWAECAIPSIKSALIRMAFEACSPLPKAMEVPLKLLWDWVFDTHRYRDQFKKEVPGWVGGKPGKEALQLVHQALETGMQISDTEDR